MDGLGEDLFAGPGAAVDEDGDVGIGDQPGLIDHLGHLGAPIDKRLAEPGSLCRLRTGGDAQGLADLIDQLGPIERFDQELGDPEVHGLDGIPDLGLAAQHDHGHERIVPVDLGQERHPVHAPHHQIRHHEVGARDVDAL